MNLRHLAKPLMVSGVLALGTLGGLAAVTAPAHAATAHPGPST
jgi:hypothetical protein